LGSPKDWAVQSSDYGMKVSAKDGDKGLAELAEYMLKVDGSVPGDEGVSARAKFLTWQIHMPAAEQAKLYKLYTGETMSTKFIPWPKIGKFSDAVATARRLGEDLPTIWACKIKLHGTNAAVCVSPDGELLSAQSRSRVINPSSDNNGFAEWAYTQKWFAHGAKHNVYVFGEWAGPGVQATCACNKTPQKVFYPFAVVLDDEAKSMYVAPFIIRAYLPQDNARIKVLPWYSTDLQTEALAGFNEEVEAIGKSDPYILKEFGIDGQGEGLVFYPANVGAMSLGYFDNYAFKAKASGFRENGSDKSIGKAPRSFSDCMSFAKTYIEPLRLEGVAQRMELGESRPVDRIPEFLTLVCSDVEEETREERAASGFEWKNIKGACSRLAVEWYRK